MDYLLINASFETNSMIESLLDDNILKEYAFSAKYKKPLSYDNILVPCIAVDESDEDFIFSQLELEKHINMTSPVAIDRNLLYSIYKVFRNALGKSKSMLISITGFISDSDLSVLYTDGSFNKASGSASYACCKLLNEYTNPTIPTGVNVSLDDFTGKMFTYDSFSGKLEEGTNNTGELTAIKTAIENFSDKPYQLIISDSIYGIKSYREYIHVWKNNGYKTYNNKAIKNKELITGTYDELMEAQKSKIILFKWTKGHVGTSFNEICDRLAKEKLGIGE